ncbi:DUF1778 domain-containing protein [Kosakonia sacchari]|uniref:type II toxin-antitoxin system TacA family antitoxin n=1 Tax=Kosakonia sacchari TaxID=1158459 RepID=UPI002ACE4725|nr:DUF1778 domain-containing protein [Kosakonia sacchari]MDZ7320028.1 DUF1778 domain-containing protein [Kosakonia sacchari]
MKTETRKAPINIRAKASQRDLTDLVAHLVSTSRTDVVPEAACREAQVIQLNQRLFIQDDKQYGAFLAKLDAPIAPERQTRINDLMSRKSPWE